MTKQATAIGLALMIGASAANGQKWTDLSPSQSDLHPTQPNGASGGRVNGLAAAHDMSAVYAATEWGGLYKSTDKGATWFHLPAHAPLATWRVAVDSINTQLIYATSFYDGRTSSLAGVNVSNDGGATWTHPASSAAPAELCPDINRTEPSAFGIAINASTRQVYVGTDCGVITSTDFGVSWTYIYPKEPKDAGRVWSVLVHHGGILDICGDGGHVRSTDGGATWIDDQPPLVTGGRCSLAVAPQDANTLFAVVGITLFESTSGGANWDSYTPSPDASSGGRIPVVATNARRGAAFDLWFGHARLYKGVCATPESTDPPSQCLAKLAPDFTAGAHYDAGELLFDPTTAPESCPLLYANDGGIDRNKNVTSPTCHDSPSWGQVKVTPHALWVRALAGKPGRLYFGTQDNGLFASSSVPPSTPTWKNVDPADVTDVGVDGPRVVNTVCCYSTGKKLFVRNPGAWTSNILANQPPPLLDGDGVVTPITGMKYGVLAKDGGVYVDPHIDQTSSVWNALATSLSTATPLLGQLSVARAKPKGGQTLFALLTFQNSSYTGGRVGQVYRVSVSNGAVNPVTPPAGAGGFGVFAVDPGNSSRFLASHLMIGMDPEMVMSNDGGASWTNLTSLDACMTRSAKFRYRSEAGPTAGVGHWSFEGYYQPTLVAFNPHDHNMLVAGAADAGIFLSFDAGMTWHPVTDPFSPETSGIPNLARPRAAYFSDGNHELYVGTQGRGVWRVVIDAALKASTTSC